MFAKSRQRDKKASRLNKGHKYAGTLDTMIQDGDETRQTHRLNTQDNRAQVETIGMSQTIIQRESHMDRKWVTFTQKEDMTRQYVNDRT